MYFAPHVSVFLKDRAWATISFPHADPMGRKEKTQTLSEFRRLLVSKIKSYVHRGSDTGDESESVTAIFVNIDQDHDGIRWEAFKNV